MGNSLKKMEELIQTLPKKDAKLCTELLDKREFDSILEIVRSNIHKAYKAKEETELLDDYIGTLIELESEIVFYTGIQDTYDDEY